METKFKNGVRRIRLDAHERRTLKLCGDVLDELKRFGVDKSISKVLASLDDKGWLTTTEATLYDKQPDDN